MNRTKPFFMTSVSALACVLAACSSSSKPVAAASTTTAAVTTQPTITPPTSTTSSSTTTSTAPPPPAETRYSTPGQFDVGTMSFKLPSGTVVDVWFPAVKGSGTKKATYDMRSFLPPSEAVKVPDADAKLFVENAFSDAKPLDDGTKFPLVLFSHGFAGFRDQSTFLTTHLASWGFVVMSPEHTSRDLAAVMSPPATPPQPDTADLLEILEHADAAAEVKGVLAIVDTAKVAAVGHSAGGGASAKIAKDPRIATYVAMAAGAAATDDAGASLTKPALFVAGSSDVIAKLESVQKAYDAYAGPKHLVVIDGVTHLGFMDVCTLSTAKGSTLDIAVADGVVIEPIITRLFADGCDKKYTAATDAWPVINQVVTAHLKSVFGDPEAAAGLDAKLSGAFGSVKVTVTSKA